MFLLIIFLKLDLSTFWVTWMTIPTSGFTGSPLVLILTTADLPHHSTFSVSFLSRFSSLRNTALSGPVPMVVHVLHSTKMLGRSTLMNSYKVSTCLPWLPSLGPCFPGKVLLSNSHKSAVGLALVLGICCSHINCSQMLLCLYYSIWVFTGLICIKNRLLTVK